MLSRWCRTVYLKVRDVVVHPHLGLDHGTLLGTILDQMQDADPFGKFEAAHGSMPMTDLHLHIGDKCIDGDMSTTVLSCANWQAAVCRPREAGLKFDESTNCIGALFATAFGAARLFRDAIGMGLFLSDHFVFDGLLLRPVTAEEPGASQQFPTNLDLGNILMVGAGSVGGSAAYCMRLLGLHCGLTVVDADMVDIINFNRSPILGKRHFQFNKARSLSTFLAGSSLAARSHECWWEQYAREEAQALAEFDIWLPLANEFDVRPNMAHQVPPLMIQASTNRNWGVNFGRHIPGRDDCLAERFAGFIPESKLRCASGEVEDVSGKKTDAALPFLSFFAGLLIAIDLIRLKLPGYPQVSNFGLFDFGGEEFQPLIVDRKPSTTCFCQSPAQRLSFQHLRRQGRYYTLAP